VIPAVIPAQWTAVEYLDIDRPQRKQSIRCCPFQT
jgi:hypothetical protein